MKLLILDGNSVINRAYFGVRPLTTRDGLYTHAIYGFLNILEKMEKEEQPDAVCVAFDLHGPTFRHEKYDGYKATRHGMPEELAQQMPVMKQVLQAMNIPIYECQGWEADDVIGTVGKVCGANDWECVIVTGDRDSLQLIDEHVHVKLVISRPGQTSATLYNHAKFVEEYGFEPPKMVDLKALMGDSSDNIPGVAGIGPKTATELLVKYGSLDAIYSATKKEDVEGNSIISLKDSYEQRINDLKEYYEKRLEDTIAHYEERLSDKRDHIATIMLDKKWFRIATCICAFALVVLFIVEILTPGMGWVRY